MSKLIMVGEAPGPSATVSGRPLEGYDRKLSDWSGVDVASEFAFVNLLDEAPKRRGKGTHWTAAEQLQAMERARDMLGRQSWAGDTVWVLLGKRVAAAFGFAALPYYVVASGEGGLFVVIPHPSGVNHLYNEEEHRKAAGAWIRWAASQERGRDDGRGLHDE